MVVRCPALALRLVAFAFERSEDREVDVEHIVFGPYGAAVLRGVSVVVSRRGELQRYLVFVVVRLVV